LGKIFQFDDIIFFRWAGEKPPSRYTLDLPLTPRIPGHSKLQKTTVEGFWLWSGFDWCFFFVKTKCMILMKIGKWTVDQAPVAQDCSPTDFA